MRITASTMGCLAILAAPAGAAQQSDIVDQIINRPPPAAHRVDGTKGSIRKDAAVQGGAALRIAVPGKNEQAWAVALANPIVKPVKAGDRLVLAFWARLDKGENGATTASLPYNAVQLAQAPYTPLLTGPVTIDGLWKLHEVRGTADKDYPADSLNVAIHLATAKQVVDIGPVFVLNLGK